MNGQGNPGAAQTRDLTFGRLINGLTLPHLWGAIAALVSAIVAAFFFGVWSTGVWSTDASANRKMIDELTFKNQFFAIYLRYAISTDPELRPADTPDLILANEHENAMNEFVEFIKQIYHDQVSNHPEEQKVRVTLEKGQDKSIAVLRFNGGPRWSIPQKIKQRVHGLAETR